MKIPYIVASIIPNEPPTMWRQQLMDASMIEDDISRAKVIQGITKDIRIAHPELFWSESELVAMNKAWQTARLARMEKDRMNKEFADLLAERAGATS